MKSIKTFWLGIPTIERNGNAVNLETRKAVALLAYLGLTSPTPTSREYLATLFWPEFDQQHANANLRRTLYSINRDLEPDFITGNRENIMINSSYLFWQDVCEFRQLLTSGKSHNHERIVCAECISNLEKATTFYRGGFLEGFNLRDSPEFDQWQYSQRENLFLEFSFCLEKLTLAYTSIGDWEKAIQKARNWVNLDPLNEKAQQTFIKLYVQAGKRSAALHQFEEYSRVLNEEFGQPPDDEMLAFYQEIRSGKTKKTNAFSDSSTAIHQLEASQQPLIKTKLFIPRPRKEFVPRPQLLEKLQLSSNKKLTLISAPAGYGKTTLLAEWINFLQKEVTPTPWAVCWFSLDAGDNDPMRFLTYLVAALEKVDLEIRTTTRDILHSVDSLYPNTPLAMLLNDLQELNQPVLLVLDDYQFISNPAIHDEITFLLDHLPINTHMVIATRSDPPIPLSRMRARGQLSELRAEDLRFNPIEITRLLNQVFALDLTQEQVIKLESRTEGWIAGLQLAGVSMQGRGDIPQFIDAFSGSHRFIMDYLAEEALSRQSLEIQSYLFKTSILERLNDSLCDFVLGFTSKGQSFEPRNHVLFPVISEEGKIRLAMLENLGLFIVPLDDERIWYRYHHLFSDLLRTRLQGHSPSSIPELHQRASIWFEKHGDIEASINHSLLAEDWDSANRLIDLYLPKYLENGQMTTIFKWLEQFPQEELFKRPKLCVQVAEMYSQAGLIDKIDPFLDKAEEIVTFYGNPEKSDGRSNENNLTVEEIIVIKSMVSILRGLKAVCSGHPQRAMEITQVALETYPEMSLKEQAVLYWVQGWAQRSLGDLNLALKLLNKGTKCANESGAILRDIWTDLGNVTRLVGKLPQAIDILEGSLQTAIDRGVPNQGNLSRDESFLSFLYYEKNQLDQAFTYAKRALTHTQWWPSHNIIATANVSLAQIMLARNDLDGSLTALQKAEDERKNRLMTPFVHNLVEVTWVQIWLKQVKWTQLDQWERTQISILDSKSESNDPIDEYLELRLIVLVRVWIEKTKLDKKEERYEACFSLIDRLERNCRRSGRGNSLVVVLLYKATVLFLKDKRNEAFVTLENCFELAEPNEYMRIFLDIGESSRALIYTYLQQSKVLHKEYALKILREFGKSKNAVSQKEAPPDVLTLRETEVLQLLVEGCSNREIAEQLFLSEGTVKFHIHNILGKLNASSRTAVIVKARELHLI